MISDFLFEDAERIKDIAELNNVHDAFLVMIDSAFAFEMPDVSAGWVSAFDVETGEERLMSRREVRSLASRVRTWQDDLERQAHDRGMDVLRIGVDIEQSLPALLDLSWSGGFASDKDQVRHGCHAAACERRARRANEASEPAFVRLRPFGASARLRGGNPDEPEEPHEPDEPNEPDESE